MDTSNGKQHGSASLLVMLALATLTAQAIAQEIVIEPTNGRPQSASHISRPAAVDVKPAGSQKPAAQQRSARKVPQKAVVKQIAAKTASAKPGTPLAMAEASTKTQEATPSPAVHRSSVVPNWMVADTRDAAGLRSEISNALAHDPALTNSNVRVTVEDTVVTLEGHAASPEERLHAERLAQSYAWNRKLVNRIEVEPRVSAKK